MVEPNNIEDDAGNEQYLALAAALAPQLKELETLMDDPLLKSQRGDSPSKTTNIANIMDDDAATVHTIQPDDITITSKAQSRLNPRDDDSDDSDYGMNLDDDDMDHEIEQLAYAEDLLGRELDMAKDFASFFGSSPVASPTADPPPSRFLKLNLNLAPETMNLNFNISPETMAAFKSSNLFQANKPEAPPQTLQGRKPTPAITPLEEPQPAPDAPQILTPLHSNAKPKIDPPPAATVRAQSCTSIVSAITETSTSSENNTEEPPQQRPTALIPPVPMETSTDPKNPFGPTVNIPSLQVQHCEADLDGDEDDTLREEEDGHDIDHIQTDAPNLDGSFNPHESLRNAPQETLHFDHTEDAGPSTPTPAAKISSATDSTPVAKNTASMPAKLPSKATPTEQKLKKIAQENSNGTGKYQYKYKTPTPARRRRTSLSNPPPMTPLTSVVLFKEPASTYTSTAHFRQLKLRKEPQGAWYSVDLTNHLVTSHGNNTHNLTKEQKDFLDMGVGLGMKEYCLSITQWKRLFVGLRLEEDEERQHQRKLQKQQQRQLGQSMSQGSELASTAPMSPQETSGSADPTTKRAPVRTISVRIRPDVLCGAVMDAVTQTLMNCPHSSIIKRQGGHLQATVRGQVPAHIQEPGQSSPAATPRRSRRSKAPRDCTFFVDCQLVTSKGAQCERVLLLRIFHWGDDSGGSVVQEEDMWSPSTTPSAANHGNAASFNTPTPTSKNGPNSPPQAPDVNLSMEGAFDDSFLLPEKDQKHEANLHLREACALIQRIESPELAKKIRPLVRKSAAATKDELRELVSEHLLANYRACPSVLQPDTTITLPALSPQDWPVIQAAWSWIHSVWDELETRELTYLSFLPMSWLTMQTPTPLPEIEGIQLPDPEPESAPPIPRFGCFPALPTLDVQLASQLRRLSREAMIGQLLKAASVLEDYARQAEYQCANLIDLLRPTFAYYKVHAPVLPKPAALASYPLDYTPPQSLCPPWGIKVMEALNQVAAMSHEAGERAATPTIPEAGATDFKKDAMAKSLESIALAEQAVQMVYEAFQQQDDEEHSARLARKNLQVMDRLTKMQEHNRASIGTLGSATTDTATAAADDFFSKAEKAIVGLHARKNGSERVECHTQPWREVPLLKWTLGVGGSSGTCTITANQLLFTPAKLIPLLGYSQSTWFHLADVEFDIVQTPATLLNPLTTTLKVLERQSGTGAYNFKPSSAGQRLKSFLDIVQKEAASAPDRPVPG